MHVVDDAGVVEVGSGADKVFKCPHCEYYARKKWNLVAHIRTHTGAKPFKCQFCEYRANEKSTVGECGSTTFCFCFQKMFRDSCVQRVRGRGNCRACVTPLCDVAQKVLIVAV